MITTATQILFIPSKHTNKSSAKGPRTAHTSLVSNIKVFFKTNSCWPGACIQVIIIYLQLTKHWSCSAKTSKRKKSIFKIWQSRGVEGQKRNNLRDEGPGGNHCRCEALCTAGSHSRTSRHRGFCLRSVPRSSYILSLQFSLPDVPLYPKDCLCIWSSLGLGGFLRRKEEKENLSKQTGLRRFV